MVLEKDWSAEIISVKAAEYFHADLLCSAKKTSAKTLDYFRDKQVAQSRNYLRSNVP
jgi:hypothetical protein